MGSALFFLLAPGTVVGLVPWLISGWRPAEPWPGGLRVLGAVVVIAGLVPLVHAGGGYDAYRAAVPAWIPRLRPWTPE